MAARKQVVSRSTRLQKLALAIGLETDDILALQEYEDVTYDDGTVRKATDGELFDRRGVMAARMRTMMATADAMIARYVDVTDRDNGIAGVRIGAEVDDEGNVLGVCGSEQS